MENEKSYVEVDVRATPPPPKELEDFSSHFFTMEVPLPQSPEEYFRKHPKYLKIQKKPKNNWLVLVVKGFFAKLTGH